MNFFHKLPSSKYSNALISHIWIFKVWCLNFHSPTHALVDSLTVTFLPLNAADLELNTYLAKN